jgi:hypothetical protein
MFQDQWTTDSSSSVKSVSQRTDYDCEGPSPFSKRTNVGSMTLSILEHVGTTRQEFCIEVSALLIEQQEEAYPEKGNRGWQRNILLLKLAHISKSPGEASIPFAPAVSTSENAP